MSQRGDRMEEASIREKESGLGLVAALCTGEGLCTEKRYAGIPPYG